MKIIALQISNFKRITAVSLHPNGSNVVLTGENGAGKSSVMDAISTTIAGGALDKPIHEGAKNGEVTVTIPGLKITRRFTPGGQSLKVENDAGEIQKSPQGILDALVGNLSFDPLGFTRMKPAEQVETLKMIAGLDFTELDNGRAKLYADRTLKNREVDTANANLRQFVYDSSAPSEEKSTAELLERLTNAANKNTQNNVKRGELEALTEQRDTAVSDAKEIQRKIDDLREQLELKEIKIASLNSGISKKSDEVNALVDEDTASLRKQITAIDELNDKARKNKGYKNAQDSLAKLKTDADTLTVKIDEIDAQKRKLLEEAKFPVEQISFDENGIVYKGNPFSQASMAEKIRVSVAIGMALNPKLKVIFVRDASLMTDASLKLLAELAAGKDYQLWIEDARSTDPAAVVIEEGELKKDVAKAD